MNGPWPQSEVLKEPRVQLKLGLNRTKGNTDLGADDAAAEYQSFMRCRSGKARWRTKMESAAAARWRPQRVALSTSRARVIG